jgi:hypothetical protein
MLHRVAAFCFARYGSLKIALVLVRFDHVASRIRERENFNRAVFALAFFSRRQDRELLGAIFRGLLDCPCRV